MATKQHTARLLDPTLDECLTMARSCLSANLRKTERLVTRHYDAYLEEAGVTAVQLPMLGVIATAPDPSFRLLASQLELDRSTLSRNIGLLQRRGMVKVGPSSGPKPGLITLTRKGRQALARAHRQWQRAHKDLLAALSSDAVSGGMDFLKLLRRTARQGVN